MMDKAKAYDEALEKARQDRDAYQKELDKTDKNSQLASILKAGISALEMVFPQLKDSDNDRIKKCLHDIVNWFSFDSKFFTNNFVTKKDVIAYLEKQKECVIDNTSEDEKMLQTIIQGFKNWKVNGMERFNGTKIDDILAYLKKQKYNRMQPVYDNQESFESALDKAWKSYNDCGSRTVDSCEDDYIESAYAKGFREGYLFGLEKQKEKKPLKVGENAYFDPNTDMWFIKKEQKPVDDKAFEEWIDDWWKHNKVNNPDSYDKGDEIQFDERGFKNFCRGIKNMYQQKSDWNEEDEEIIYSLRSFLIQAEQSGKYGSIQIAQIEQCLNWLKSVHPIKQDWTEEDEEIWFALITFFKTYLQKYPPACKDEKIQADRILKWLNTTIKSFRLHHRYKPSKEQIEALERTIHLSNFGTEENRRNSLSSLLKELKKLGVKEEPEYYQYFDSDC